MFLKRNTQHYKDNSYKCKAIPKKFQQAVYGGRQVNTKLHIEKQRCKNNQNNIKDGLALTDSVMYCRASMIKTGMLAHEHINSSCTECKVQKWTLGTCGNLMCDRGDISYHWVKDGHYFLNK